MSKVVHLSNDAHAVAKVYCKENGLKMSDWVASLITRAITAESAPEPVAVSAPALVIAQPPVLSAPVQEEPTGPRKKKLARLDEEEGGDGGVPAYARPPFWASSTEDTESAEASSEASENAPSDEGKDLDEGEGSDETGFSGSVDVGNSISELSPFQLPEV